MAGFVVQKYGGSSLVDARAIKAVAGRIAARRRTGDHVVAVVSAMGDHTDELTALALEVNDRPDRRELDVLLSTGELVSCTLTTMALNALGEPAKSLAGWQAGIQTTSRFGRAQISGIDVSSIHRELGQGNIVIIAGFQGIAPGQEITTLGRGGSDTTAVAVAAALGADRCEIYTDVDGIYTADPRFVPAASKLEEIGFEEMLEMASHGAKMQPRAVELAMVYNVPTYVASSFTDAPGTLIHEGADMTDEKHVGEVRKRVRGIVTDTGFAKITILGVSDRPGLAARVFEPLSAADVSVDEIVMNAGQDAFTDFTFTVRDSDLERALEVVEPLTGEMRGRGTVSAGGLGKVSIVGTGMRDEPGYASRMFGALAEHGINIELITTSEIRITCIVAERHLGDAARALHAVFELG
ncbi:MAG: aspartate kinase [Dehalococcoidia bacterium]|nr:aspartate kinase [Dehalococcoidia bacterium]